MARAILVLNAGSSSIKFALFHVVTEGRDRPLCEGQLVHIDDGAHFTAQSGKGVTLVDRQLPVADHACMLNTLLAWLGEQFADLSLAAVGHRVVHGGPRYTVPIVIDDAVLAELRRLVPLAPLHQPQHIAAIEAVQKRHPVLLQIACFDTAFHHTQPVVATQFALPRALSDEGLRRYGFHGLSYEYIAGAMTGVMGRHRAAGRVIVAHLGSGASLCAMLDGRSVATTMGLTALDGLMMSRRCGSLDPGVLLYLLQAKQMSASQIETLLYHDSGLQGVSGMSDDMQTLLASKDPRAAEAIDLFVYRIGRELGSLAAALGGLDALVFTGGIGEHAVTIRQRVCIDAAWLGLRVDEIANQHGGPCLTLADSPASAWLIPTDEDLMIARHTRSLLPR